MISENGLELSHAVILSKQKRQKLIYKLILLYNNNGSDAEIQDDY